MNIKLAGFVGSLRKGSYNRALFESFKKFLPEGVEIEEAVIRDFPLYNEDLENDFPEVVRKNKELVESSQGLVFFTPEYNRSVPGPLKNAMDWVSRPYGENSFKEKPVFVMGASSGNIATALSQQDLKQVLLYLNTRILGQPEFYLGAAHEKFNKEGELIDEKTKEKIAEAISAFLKHVKLFI